MRAVRLSTRVEMVRASGRKTLSIQGGRSGDDLVRLLKRRALTMEALPWAMRWLMETQSGRGAW